MAALPDIDPADIDVNETAEWLEALNAIIEQDGQQRAHFLLEKLIAGARGNGVNFTDNAQPADRTQTCTPNELQTPR